MRSISIALVAVALSRFAGALDNGAARLPPRGWSSWNSFGLSINEEVVRSSARMMAAKLLQSGYEYLLIDDGWPPDTAHAGGAGPARLPDGTIPVSSEKFPSGFRNLTDYVHSLGLKIGICACHHSLPHPNPDPPLLPHHHGPFAGVLVPP